MNGRGRRRPSPRESRRRRAPGPHPVPRPERPPRHLPVEHPDEHGEVTIRFLGAARTTTGSLHRIRTPAGDLLLECGLYQGHRAEAEAWNRRLPLDPRKVRAVILSHVHVDHCGALPSLVRMGYEGPIHMTAATADMLPILLYDSAHLQAADLERVNRRLPPRERKEPLYLPADVERTLRLVRRVGYDEEFEPLPGTTARLVDAGHILGSAAVHLTIRAPSGVVRVGFSGDLGRRDVPILRDPVPLPDVDHYLTETTYGDREHEGPGDVEAHLERVVKRVVARRGKVLVPAFAVGRTQLLVYLLHRLRAQERIPDVPIYVDSPMASAATQVFARHRGLYDRDAQQFLDEEGPLFRSPRTVYVSDSEASRALNGLEGPAVIVSASGMCEGGRILHHLKHHGVDPRNLILFVGYQAEHTLGRRILEGRRDVKVFGEPLELAAEVESIEGLSAHADRRGLLAYLRRLPRPPRRVYLVHGESDKVDAFAAWLRENGVEGVVGPAPGDWHPLL